MTQALAIPDLAQAESVAQQADAHASNLLAFAQAYVCTDDGSEAMRYAEQLKAQGKAFDAEREVFDAVIRPLRQASLRWKPPADKIEAARRLMVNKATARQQYLREEQTRQLTAATTATEVQAAVSVLVARPTGLSERESWTFEIVNIDEVPDEYFVLDEARLGREARASKGALKVPGVRPVRNVIGVQR